MSSTNVTCNSGANGVATATITGSNGPFSCTWSNGTFAIVTSGNSTSIPGLTAGVYSIYVVDQLGCSSVNLVTITEPQAVSGSTSVTNVLCNGQSTGAVNLSPTGGTSPYTYVWSNGAGTEDISNVPAGTYTVTLSDANGCGNLSLSSIITQPSQAVTSSIVTTNISCLGGSDGAADLSAYGGVPPYSYNWNSGTFVSEDLVNVPAGTYSITVTDENGCTNTNSIILTEPTAITSSVTVTNVLCYGQSTGSVNLTLSGGTPPYSYSWSNSTFTLGSTEDLSNVPAEFYSVLITDDNGCTSTNTGTVTQPTQIQTTITSTNVSCNGYSDGSIDLFVIGGTPNYTYQWSNSSGNISTSEDLLNIPAEIYSVLVTDNNGCTATNGVEITQPSSPLLLSSTQVNILCFGNNTGAIDLSVSGGTFPYTYSWSNAEVTQDVSNLFAGSYITTVVDDNGCSTSATITLTQPAAPVTSNVSVTDVSCNGGNNGAVNLTVSGGTSPYTYSWINSTFNLSETSEDLNNFPAEEYTVTITDNNGCTEQNVATISEPSALSILLTPVDVLCYGDSTGSITSSVNGGVTPYSYVWSNGNITQNISNLPAGLYDVSVTDANNCLITQAATIHQPVSGLSSYYNSTEPTCYGYNDAEINFTVNGGTLPYAYLWSTGDNVANIYNLTAGSYSCIVTDDNGCSLVELISITQPDAISITGVTTPADCFGYSNGTIDVTVSGGTPNYDFTWSNSTFVLAEINEDISGYPADDYIVSVTDSLGCSNSASFSITEPALLEGELTSDQIACYGGGDGAMAVMASGGNGSYTYSWSNGASTSAINNLSPGTYSVTITDAKGCALTLSDSIYQPEQLIAAYTVTAVTCSDQSDGTVQMAPTGGYAGYTYQWEHGPTDDYLSDLEGGVYSVTVTDMVGCTADTTVTIEVTDAQCIDIPNAFTPEGDGYNDTWMITNIDLYANCVVKIYNVWGNLLYESTGTYVPWDGTENGRALPPATYYYIIKLDSEDKDGFSGAVTIVK